MLTNFAKSEEKKEKFLSISYNSDFTHIHSNIYECIKKLEKLLGLINLKFYDTTDMFHKYKSRSPEVFCKNAALESFAKLTRRHL